tara:strand:- start:24 stop:1454 length:1431 start_codon:yes stop_codon:yes gene_type:complete
MWSLKNKYRKKLLYIPLEIYDRELDGGLLLALEAIKRNWDVIIGSQENLINNIENNLPGVYFLKHITPGQIKIQKRINNSGNIIFVQDQEGLLQRPGLEYKIRFSECSIASTKKIFFWGEEQKKDFLDSFGTKNESKCIVTGSPRADHWELISRRRNNHDKNFILIATSFCDENHALGSKGQYNLLRDVAGVKIGANSEESIYDYFDGMYKLSSLLLPYYKKLVLKLSKEFKNEKIILRPHPSESLDMWLELTQNLENVEVRNDETIIDWLLKSKLLIQYGSSCAIQANILKVPVITLIPEVKKLEVLLNKYNLTFASKSSIVCKNIKTVISKCKEIIDEKANYLLDEYEHLDKLIFSRKTNDSSKRILDEIEKIFKNNEKIKIIKDGTLLSYKFSKFKQSIVLIISIFPLWDRFAPSKYSHISWKTFRYYKKRKQPKLEFNQFKENLETINKISQQNLEIGIKKYLKDVYKLYKK